MAVFVKSVGCGCSHCGPDPCTPGVPVITSGSSIPGNLCSAISYTTTATNSPTSFSCTGTLPSGVSFNTSTGVFSGTPTVAGDFPLTLRAINACGNSDPLNIEINIATCNLVLNPIWFTAGPNAAVSASYLVSGDFPCDQDVDITCYLALGDTSVEVFADGISLYSSGCVSAGTYSATVTVPAGTVDITVEVELGCDGTTQSNASIVLECV